MEKQDEVLSEFELQRQKEIKKLEEEHKGHESMHAEMLLIFFGTLIVAQVVLVQWKNRHPKSYNNAFTLHAVFNSYMGIELLKIATLVGMWLIPIAYTLKKFWWRFVFSWLVYTLFTSLVFYKATRKPLTGSTPRLVYRWFLLLFRVSYAIGIVGYIVLMLTFFGINLLLLISPETALDIGVILLFYGLYYGIISRDFAEICSESMASTIGYYTKTGIPTKQLSDSVCAICGLELVIPRDESDLSVENVFKLTCYHTFHEACIRGWCIVGKKQTCPYCKEKVDLKRMFKSPWERPHIMYGQLLDWIRYLVAWQPVIIFIVHIINWFLGLK